ncbi:MAG: CHRD domain-containing protein [Crocinitomicaceae bacterium]
MKKIIRLGTAFLGILISSGSAFAGHLEDELLITAKLDGDQSVPSVTTNAVGVASFTLNSSWDTMFVNISVNGLSGPITGIHVHEGLAGTSGGVITDLGPFVTRNRVITHLTGADLTAEMISNYLNGSYYVNVHTDANPGGEIRGQLGLERDWGFRADLDTMQQNAPVTNEAFGVSYFNLSHDQSTLEVRMAADGLSGAITASHLHYGLIGTDGGVALDLSPYIVGNTIVGEIDVTGMTDLIEAMIADSIYINLHTAANPGGEIRGQLWLDNRISFDSWLNTAQQVTPPVGATGTGSAYLSLNTTLDTMWYEIQAESMTGAITAAHLHDGAVGVDGGVLIDLSGDIVGNRISGMITGVAITTDLVSKLLKGEVYINMHTAMNAGGEIRGQVYRNAREGYALALEGNQLVPTEFSVAKGGGIVSVNRDQTDAHFMIVVSDLTGPLTASHFHNASVGVNGGVLLDLTPYFSGSATDDAAFGYWKSTDVTPFTTASSVEFRNNDVYVNIHTAEKPNGEVRGQVLRGAQEFWHQTVDNGMRPEDPLFNAEILFSAKLTGDQEVPVVTTSATGVGGFLLNATRDTIWVNINLDGLSGPITGMHIHEGAVGATGPVVEDLGPMLTGNQARGFITGFELNKYITGAYYVNVHTDAEPNGEIRGQIGFETDWTFEATLEGAQEVPAVTTTAQGKGVFNLSKDETALEIRIVSTGLSGPITGAHLHVGAAGTNGAAVEDLSAFIVDNSISVTVDPTAYLADLKAGDIYINIHTDANAGGEIRGQLSLTEGFILDTWMNGAQEDPEEDVAGQGVGTFWFNETWDTLSYDILVDQLSASISGIHIHNGAVGVSGAVDVDLSGDVTGNSISGIITGASLTTDLIDRLILGESYVNLHTSMFPNGEIRGQVYRLARDGYSYTMCGEQEAPAIEVDGYGGGILSTDRYNTNAHLMFTTTDLTGAITGSHIHNGAVGTAGAVLYDVSGDVVDNSAFTYVVIDSAAGSQIKLGNTYINVHTAANAGGEVRGQFDNTTDCANLAVGLDNLSNDAFFNVYPNPFNTSVTIRYDFENNENAQVIITDILGNSISVSNLASTSGTETFELSELPSGIYFVNLILDNATMKTLKMVKQ